MKVREIMSDKLITCKKNQTIAEGAKIMVENNISALPIIGDQGELVGMITESDFIGKMENVPHALVSLKSLFGETYYHGKVDDIFSRAKDKPLSEVMSSPVQTIDPESSITSAVDIMLKKQRKRIPVVENGKLVGIITRKDLLRTML